MHSNNSHRTDRGASNTKASTCSGIVHMQGVLKGRSRPATISTPTKSQNPSTRFCAISIQRRPFHWAYHHIVIYQTVILHVYLQLPQPNHAVDGYASFATREGRCSFPAGPPGRPRSWRGDLFWKLNMLQIESRIGELEGRSIALFRTMMTRRFVRLRSQELPAPYMCLVEIPEWSEM